jgi:hypothetical protein
LDREGYYPFMELHEILHGFGFEHSENECSIMYPYSNNQFIYDNLDVCSYGKKPHIDKGIIKDLKEIYGGS